jgi:transcriptional regulator with XRE-family HTH domain
LDFTPAFLLEVEKGRNKPGFDFFYRLAERFNVNLHFLLFGEGSCFMDDTYPLLINGKKMGEEEKEFLLMFLNSKFFRFRALSLKQELFLTYKNIIDRDMSNHE